MHLIIKCLFLFSLLTRYPTALRLSKAKAKSVARIPYVSRERAQQLVAIAKKSVASADDEVTEQLIIATAKQILDLNNTIKAQTKILTDKCRVPEVELLKTFNGISDYSAIGLMLEIQSVKRFLSSKKIASFFGIHPAYKKSGDGTWKYRMSKKGRREPRRILFMVAMSAIKSNPLIRSIYQPAVQRGMQKKAAVGLEACTKSFESFTACSNTTKPQEDSNPAWRTIDLKGLQFSVSKFFGEVSVGFKATRMGW